jgi:hypothetical protein
MVRSVFCQTVTRTVLRTHSAGLAISKTHSNTHSAKLIAQ